MFGTGTLDELREQSTVGCFPQLCFYSVFLGAGAFGLRKQLINNLVFSNFARLEVVHKYFYSFAPNPHCALIVAISEKIKIPFSMAIGNGTTHECLPKHSSMGTTRMK